MPGWVIPVTIFALFGMFGVAVTAQLVATRGVKILDSRCAWDEEHGAYVAEVVAENREAVPKLVKLNVQGRFKPRAGGRWPSDEIKYRYEAVTQPVTVELPPHGRQGAATAFVIPGAADFSCQAVASVGQQQRQEM